MNTFEWKNTPQFSIVQLLFAVFTPSAVAFIGFRAVLPRLVTNGIPVMIAWPSVASIMLFGFVIVAIMLLRREAKDMGITLWTRMCFKKLGLKEWGIYIILIIAGLIGAGGVQKMIPDLGITVPDYMPFFLNPSIDPTSADMQVLSPGLPLQGSYGLLPLIGITLLLNILTEELYFRAWLLPKLARYGNAGWVMNGVLFALYHTFQIWLLPTILVTSLLFAFIFYKSKSIWPILAAHLVGNFLLSILGILMLIIA